MYVVLKTLVEANSMMKTHSPLELIHSDVWGPAITSVGGFKYYVEQAFYSFQKHVERLFNSKILIAHSDWGWRWRVSSL